MNTQRPIKCRCGGVPGCPVCGGSNVESLGTIESIGDVLERMAMRDDAESFGEQTRAAIAIGLGRTEEQLISAYTERFYNQPPELAKLLLDIPVWPCGHELETLLDTCRAQMGQVTKGPRWFQLQAAERCLHRMMGDRDRLTEGRKTA